MKRNRLMALLSIILCISITGCSSSVVAFDYKVKPEYADKLTTEDAAILIDYLKVANELPTAANAKKEEIEIEQAVIDMGFDAVDHFSEVDGDLAIEVSKLMISLGAIALDIKNAKTKHHLAELDEELGVKSEYEEYLNIDNIMENKRESAKEDLNEFKKYID
ncbi:hypothetical protein [Paenibacillus illinoisensis]|uniref:hypothetical protein n=1 Tax=Paenibacillus illinoisensis TaxID=59845 RepID=UPI00203EE8A6|nr:hypothetical protein [Paenibacillus illinoisensis]MCM3202896.1 hypothetical protein [Paenibacillus illinoisensis]